MEKYRTVHSVTGKYVFFSKHNVIIIEIVPITQGSTNVKEWLLNRSYFPPTMQL